MLDTAPQKLLDAPRPVLLAEDLERCPPFQGAVRGFQPARGLVAVAQYRFGPGRTLFSSLFR